MKKIVFVTLLSICSVFAFDMGSTLKAVGGTMGITADSLGNQLTDIVKQKSPSSAEQAKSLCTQASTYKSFVGVADKGMMNQAIQICTKKSVANTLTK